MLLRRAAGRLMLATLQRIGCRGEAENPVPSLGARTDGASGATDYRILVAVLDLGEGVPVATEARNGEVTTQGECTDCTARESSFDVLAGGVVNGRLPRR